MIWSVGIANRPHEPFLQMIHPDDQPRVREAFDRAIHDKTEYETEYRIVRSDGSIRHVKNIAHPVFSQSGTLIEYVGTAADITEQKLAEEALHEAQSELARVSRVMTMGELTASIAHEVNQPLAAVVANANAGLSWLAATAPNLDEARAALGRIIRDANRASDVVTRIRAFLRRTGTATAPLNMNEAVEDVIAIANGELGRNSVTVGTELAADLPPVLGDRVQVQQVMLNLIMNAIEAMAGIAEQARELVIKTSRDQADRVCVSVKDSGIGLKPEDLQRLFDAFYTTKPNGMGMGLSISRSIIEAHRGRLWATQNDGPGMTFQFTLPVAVGSAS